MKEIKLVTAFFNINRDVFEIEEQRRSLNTYLEYFRFWARIQNDLIIYCEPENIEVIKRIRDEFKRDNTVIIPIKNFYNIEEDLFNKMSTVEGDPSFQNMRQRKVIENTAKYDYVTFLKSWCLKDAAEKVLDDCILVWIDFGWNHAGWGENGFYIDEKDFDFYWEYPFENKVYMSCCRDPDSISIVESLYYLTDCFQGGMVVCPKNLCSLYYKKIKEAVKILLNIDCIDDDQMLNLIAYRRNPELFHITLASWFSEFDTYTNRKFKKRIQRETNPNLISF